MKTYRQPVTTGIDKDSVFEKLRGYPQGVTFDELLRHYRLDRNNSADDRRRHRLNECLVMLEHQHHIASAVYRGQRWYYPRRTV